MLTSQSSPHLKQEFRGNPTTYFTTHAKIHHTYVTGPNVCVLNDVLESRRVCLNQTKSTTEICA